MSNYDFMMTTLYNDIKNEIIELWNLYDKDDDNIEDIIEEFKLEYGNRDDSIYYYDFDITTRVQTQHAQRFIIQKTEDMGYDMDITDLKRMTTSNGLEVLLIYWIMEDIDFTTISSN